MPELTIPALETDRLCLVPLAESHSEGMFELFSSPEVCRYCPQAVDANGRKVELPVRERAESDKIIGFFLDYAEQGKGFRWAMIDKQSGAFVGALGYNSLGRTAELAYHQVPKFWGQGLMTEACACALKWNRESWGSEQIEAFIDEGNHPSIKLAERMGFKKTPEIREGALRYVLNARPHAS